MSKRKTQSAATIDDPWVKMLTEHVMLKARASAAELVAQRFTKSGIRLTPSERKQFADHFGGQGPLPTITRKRRAAGAPKVISLTPEDDRRFKLYLNRLLKAGVRALPSLSDNEAGRRLKDLKRQWPSVERSHKHSVRAFRTRLQVRWGKPLTKLNLLISFAREFGTQLSESRVEEPPEPHLVEVITRLHARACQVSLEVYELLCAGLADGAIARCRTLQEIAATAFFIKDNGDITAERYMLHEGIESWRAAHAFNEHAAALNEEPYSDAEMNVINQRHTELLQRFGKSFAGHYGWASHLPTATGDPVTSFTDIERLQLPHLRPYYQFASHNVHAKAKGIYHRLGAIHHDEVLLAGASNTGLSTPGQIAAISLCQTTVSLAMIDVTFENLTAVKLMGRLQREICSDFATAHRRLLRDDLRIRRQMEKSLRQKAR